MAQPHDLAHSRSVVLVVEDESDVRALLRELLERAGYDVVEAATGREGLRALYVERPHLVLLDVLLPDLDGWEALERIRDASDVPVLMLTALTTELDKVRGLRGGADDYVTKPFGRHELIARVQALLRRAPSREPIAIRYDDGLIALDERQRSAAVAGREVSLTPLEYRLLRAFVGRPEEVLAHEELLELVWGTTRGVSHSQVRLYVNYLRRKLGEPAAAAIETVRGFGYRYRPPAG